MSQIITPLPQISANLSLRNLLRTTGEEGARRCAIWVFRVHEAKTSPIFYITKITPLPITTPDDPASVPVGH